MRRAAKKDGNQAAIVEALRAAGASVSIINEAGIPDLLIGFCGVNLLAEVKDPAQPKAGQRLKPDQVKWHREWKGQKTIVYSVADALALIERDL